MCAGRGGRVAPDAVQRSLPLAQPQGEVSWTRIESLITVNWLLLGAALLQAPGGPIPLRPGRMLLVNGKYAAPLRVFCAGIYPCDSR